MLPLKRHLQLSISLVDQLAEIIEFFGLDYVLGERPVLGQGVLESL